MAVARPLTLAELAARAEEEAQRLDRELEEIDLLLQQARIEAARHEQRRAQQGEKVTTIEGRRQPSPAELQEAMQQLVTLTRRTALMEAQIDVLAGKQRVLNRFRDQTRQLAAGLGEVMARLPVGQDETGETSAALPPALSRAVLNAQEDLRRDIARAMHDGPAQSLTNIVLRAQIVERLMSRDPAAAQREAHQLVGMVQQTLEATKTFIFDVRPMVLDDLGLVPTLRRAAGDRGRRARIPIEFDSIGADLRLPADVESGLFRIVDEALEAFLKARPERVAIRLDWTDTEVIASIGAVAVRPPPAVAPASEAEAPPEEPAADLPPALAAMIRERRDAAAAAAIQAQRAADASVEVALPQATWKGIVQRATTVGVHVELAPDGHALTARVGLS